MDTRTPEILDHLASQADQTRSRILLLLDPHELTVSELCDVLQLPQSTVSRHLKALADDGWIVARAEGTSRPYAMKRGDLDPSARRLWHLVREHVSSTGVAVQDQHRLQTALAERRTRSQEFFASSAGQWDHLRDELFGDRFHLAALAALAGARSVAGDLGCGTGQTSLALAPFVARVVAVDSSTEMLLAAKRRLHGVDNVELRRGDLEALPIDDGRLDLATLMVVLHHVAQPGRAIGEAARVLRPGGRVVVADMLPHDRDAYRQQMGHVWLGFARDDMTSLLRNHGFEDVRVVPLPADRRAKGPALFVATAVRGAEVKTDAVRVDKA
jgi:ArsR family transcriptional regulator